MVGEDLNIGRIGSLFVFSALFCTLVLPVKVHILLINNNCSLVVIFDLE